MTRIGYIIVVALVLAGCETPTTQRYAVSADNNLAIRAMNQTGIGLGSFQEPTNFDSSCRMFGPMQIADGLSHGQYIRKAFEDELKMAGAYATGSPRVRLSGKLNKLEFSSTSGLTGGYWTIDLALVSSNGKQMRVGEHYEFNSGFEAGSACRNVAEAFSRAVQNLVSKAVRNPAFSMLLT